MSLRLRVVSEQRVALGQRATAEFGGGGGSIGRSADNDWVLPDPQRYISGHHARIRFRDGRFLLEDLSTNGVYVNDEDDPVSASGPRPLEHGDVLRLGEYHIVVSVDATRSQSAPAPAAALTDQPPPAPAGPTPVSLLTSDLGVPIDISSMLEITQDAALESAPRQRDPADSGSHIDIDSEAVARRLEALARAAAKRDRALQGTGQPPAPGPGGAAGLEAFCRGAGIPAHRLPTEAHARLLTLAGQLMREALVGLKDLQRSRQDQRNRFRIELPADPDDPRPSVAKSTIEDLLVDVLTQHESRRIDAVEWLRENFEAVRVHQEAADAAVREAFVEFLDRLDPAELEARFARAARRNRPEDQQQANWELYREFYRNLAEMPPQGLPRTFVDGFSAAYLKNAGKRPLP